MVSPMMDVTLVREYHGTLDRDRAAQLVAGPPAKFLLRKATGTDPHQGFSLTLCSRSQTVKHYRVVVTPDAVEVHHYHGEGNHAVCRGIGALLVMLEKHFEAVPCESADAVDATSFATSAPVATGASPVPSRVAAVSRGGSLHQRPTLEAKPSMFGSLEGTSPASAAGAPPLADSGAMSGFFDDDGEESGEGGAGEGQEEEEEEDRYVSLPEVRQSDGQDRLAALGLSTSGAQPAPGRSLTSAGASVDDNYSDLSDLVVGPPSQLVDSAPRRASEHGAPRLGLRHSGSGAGGGSPDSLSPSALANLRRSHSTDSGAAPPAPRTMTPMEELADVQAGDYVELPRYARAGLVRHLLQDVVAPGDLDHATGHPGMRRSRGSQGSQDGSAGGGSGRGEGGEEDEDEAADERPRRMIAVDFKVASTNAMIEAAGRNAPYAYKMVVADVGAVQAKILQSGMLNYRDKPDSKKKGEDRWGELKVFPAEMRVSLYLYKSASAEKHKETFDLTRDVKIDSYAAAQSFFVHIADDGSRIGFGTPTSDDAEAWCLSLNAAITVLAHPSAARAGTAAAGAAGSGDRRRSRKRGGTGVGGGKKEKSRG